MDKEIVFMLKALFKYSENHVTQDLARRILLDRAVVGPDSKEITKGAEGVYGTFMKYVCQGNFFGAFNYGGITEKDALATAMGAYIGCTSDSLWDTGLEPEDYLPEGTHTERLTGQGAVQYVRDVFGKK